MKPIRAAARQPGGPTQRVLVVEDEPALAETFAAFLRARGRFEVVLARDAAEALVKARSSPPDVAVLDLEVRGLDGAALLGQLRQDDAALPALACDGARGGELAQGFDALFLKPLDLTALLVQIERTLASAGRGRK